MPNHINLPALLAQSAQFEQGLGDQALRGAALQAQTTGAASQRLGDAQGDALRSATQSAVQAQRGAQQSLSDMNSSISQAAGRVGQAFENKAGREFTAGENEANRDLLSETNEQNQANADRDFKSAQEKIKMDRLTAQIKEYNKAMVKGTDPKTNELFDGLQPLADAYKQAINDQDLKGVQGLAVKLEAGGAFIQAVDLSRSNYDADAEQRTLNKKLQSSEDTAEKIKREDRRKELLGVNLGSVESAAEANLKALDLTDEQKGLGYQVSPTKPYDLTLGSVAAFDDGMKELSRVMLARPNIEPEQLRKYIDENDVDEDEWMILTAFWERQFTGIRRETSAGTITEPSSLQKMFGKLEQQSAAESRLMGNNLLSNMRNMTYTSTEIGSRSADNTIEGIKDDMIQRTDGDAQMTQLAIIKAREAGREIAERDVQPGVEPLPMSVGAEIIAQKLNYKNYGNTEKQNELDRQFTDFVIREKDLLVSVPNRLAREALSKALSKAGTGEPVGGNPLAGAQAERQKALEAVKTKRESSKSKAAKERKTSEALREAEGLRREASGEITRSERVGGEFLNDALEVGSAVISAPAVVTENILGFFKGITDKIMNPIFGPPPKRTVETLIRRGGPIDKEIDNNETIQSLITRGEMTRSEAKRMLDKSVTDRFFANKEGKATFKELSPKEAVALKALGKNSGKRIAKLENRVDKAEKEQGDALKALKKEKSKSGNRSRALRPNPARASREIQKAAAKGLITTRDAAELNNRIREEGLGVDEIKDEIKRSVRRATGAVQVF